MPLGSHRSTQDGRKVRKRVVQFKRLPKTPRGSNRVDPSPTLYSALNLASEGPITGQSFALRLDRDIPHCRKVLAGYCHDGYLRITHRSKSGGGGHPTTYVATDKGTAKLAQLKNQRE